MGCAVCERLKEDESRALKVLLDTQNELDHCISTAASVAEYRRLRNLFSEAKLNAKWAQLEAEKHRRNCQSAAPLVNV